MAAPKPGHRIGNHEFIGGDPNKPANWVDFRNAAPALAGSPTIGVEVKRWNYPPTRGEIRGRYMFLGGDANQPEELRRKQSKNQSNWREIKPGPVSGPVNAAVQGVTLGTADELQSAVGAVPAMLQTGQRYPEAYKGLHREMEALRNVYNADNPIAGPTAEMLGGIGTGGFGVAKAVSRIPQISNVPRWATATGMGGAEGGVYGAAGAPPGSRAKGAMIGAGAGSIAAPVAGGVISFGGTVAKGIGRHIARKLNDTPRAEALRALRSAAEKEGMNPDEVLAAYESLGPEGMIADVGENFRALLRAASDVPGPVKAGAKKTLYARQLGQGARLQDAAEQLLGARAADLPRAASEIIEQRFQMAEPYYRRAYEFGIDMTPRLEKVLNRDAMKNAMAKARGIASNYGDTFDPGSLKHLHYAKQALWEAIDSARGRAKNPLKAAYGELLDAIGEQNNLYITANGIWSDSSKLLDATLLGRDFFKMSSADMAEAVRGLTKGEREMFEMGTMAAFQDLLDNTQLTSDATRKFLGTTGVRKKLNTLFGDDAAAARFISAAEREQAFTQTKNVVAGGSPTSQNLQGQRWLTDAIQPEAMTGDPMMLALNVAAKVLGRSELSTDALQQISETLMNKGLTAAQVRQIFKHPRFTMAVNRQGLGLRGAIGAGAGYGAAQQE